MKLEMDIPNLQKVARELEVRREAVVDHWVARDEVTPIFQEFQIDGEWFKENYGDHILNHFIKIIHGEREPGNCPYMNRMITFLKDRNLVVSEIFTICVNLRKSVREILFSPVDPDLLRIREGLDLPALCNEINLVFDANLKGVLEKFQSSITTRDRQIQEYMEIVDKNVIISKTDTKGIIIYVSEAFCEASGYSRKELIGKPHNIVRHPDMDSSFFLDLWSTIQQGDVWQGEIKNRQKNGKPYWVEGSVEPLWDREGNLYGYMAIRHDITHTVMMFTDPLTRIYNRLKFEESLEFEISRYRRYQNPFSIILFDIDNFKSINDSLGHRKGDEVLVRLTELVQSSIRDSDIFARWGGEEFVILTYGDITEAHNQAERLRRTMETTEILSERMVSCSFGVTGFLSNDSEDTLFNRADEHLYVAKRNGKNRVISDLTERISAAPEVK